MNIILQLGVTTAWSVLKGDCIRKVGSHCSRVRGGQRLGGKAPSELCSHLISSCPTGNNKPTRLKEKRLGLQTWENLQVHSKEMLKRRDADEGEMLKERHWWRRDAEGETLKKRHWRRDAGETLKKQRRWRRRLWLYMWSDTVSLFIISSDLCHTCILIFLILSSAAFKRSIQKPALRQTMREEIGFTEWLLLDEQTLCEMSQFGQTFLKHLF